MNLNSISFYEEKGDRLSFSQGLYNIAAAFFFSPLFQKHYYAVHPRTNTIEQVEVLKGQDKSKYIFFNYFL
jgi:hypothetical protein